MIVIRSFDVNLPGEDAETLKGGVAGGTILKGVLKVGDEVEIRPGIIRRDWKTGAVSWEQIYSKITSLKADDNHLMFAVPGGLIGVGLKVDPYITRSDRLVGQIIGHPGKMPDVVVEIEAQYYLLRRLLGVKSEGGDKTKSKVQKLKVDEVLMINIGSTSLGGKVISFNSDQVRIQFLNPVCANEGEKIAMSRRIDKNFRLIGWGQIKKGHTSKSQKKGL
jgi:translation initiation factor 2 subunit 3